MGEQDALPSTQDAFPIAEPQVIITPQVSSGRAVDALMKFLPREVMVEVVDPSREEPREPKEPKERVERAELSDVAEPDITTVSECIVEVSPIIELAQAVALRGIAEPVEAETSPYVAETPARPAAARKAKARLARHRSAAAASPLVAVEPMAATIEAGGEVAAVSEQDSPSPIAELARVVGRLSEVEERAAGGALVEPALCYAANGGNVVMTLSAAGPSSPLSAFDFSRISSFADDPPLVSPKAGTSTFPLSKRLSHLAHLLVPDFLGRLIQHPILQILAGIGVSLLVLWWILGQ